MGKELLIYGYIHSQSAVDFLNQFNEIGEDEEVTVRINTEGGKPEYGWGMAAKFQEHKGVKKAKVDGQAHSMGLFYCCYADTVEALDVSEFTLHRAAYRDWIENSELFTDDLKDNLARINKSLRSAFEAKVDVAKFEEITGAKMNDVFSMDSRIDVSFNAATAKKIGLVDKVIKITPSKRAEIDRYAIAASTGVEAPVIPTEQKINKKKNMDIKALKADHPELYAQAVQEGVTKERDRVGACMVFMAVDADGVKAAIESGEDLTQKQMAEFSLKAVNAASLKNIGEEAPGATDTKAVDTKEPTAEQKELADFENEITAKIDSKFKKD